MLNLLAIRHGNKVIHKKKKVKVKHEGKKAENSTNHFTLHVFSQKILVKIKVSCTAFATYLKKRTNFPNKANYLSFFLNYQILQTFVSKK